MFSPAFRVAHGVPVCVLHILIFFVGKNHNDRTMISNMRQNVSPAIAATGSSDPGS